jgi:hypothetical protein
MLAGMNSGKVLRMDIQSHTIQQVADSIGAGDGLERYKTGWLVANWNGAISYIGSDGDVMEILNSEEAKLNTADIEVIEEKNLLLIPTFFGNMVSAYELTKAIKSVGSLQSAVGSRQFAVGSLQSAVYSKKGKWAQFLEPISLFDIPYMLLREVEKNKRQLFNHILKTRSLRCNITKTLLLSFFVIFKISFKEHHLSIIFKGEDVRSQAVDKPTIVGYHQDTAGEIFQSFFQCTKGVDINIISRLIEE